MSEPATTVEERTVVAGSDDGGRRLDEFLATTLAIGRRAAMRLVARVRVNGRRASKGQRLSAGDEVHVPALDVAAQLDDAPREDGAVADAASVAQIEVVRATPQVLVLAKPAVLPSVALRGGAGDSFAARIARRFPECAGVGRPGECGLVHRLDGGTSGLLLVARSAAAHDALRAQFRTHRVRKEYLAVVGGRLTAPARIDTPIGQHRNTQRRMRAVAGELAARRYAPRPASTDVVPERVLRDGTVVRAATSTGVRHQIRVHLASIGHPLLGDALYDGRPLGNAAGAAHPAGDGGFLLHATRITWHDPELDGEVTDELAPPSWWDDVLAPLDASS